MSDKVQPYEFECKGGKILVFSDLHWGDLSFKQNHGELERFYTRFEKEVPNLSHVVLNGDIIGGLLVDNFDHFQGCIARLKAWTGLAPNTQFHYLLGNHDMTESLVRQLEEAFSGTNLNIVHVSARSGNLVFTHGDSNKGYEPTKNYAHNKRTLGTVNKPQV